MCSYSNFFCYVLPSFCLFHNVLLLSLYVGIQYLREYLNLPQEIVPATLKRPVRTEGARPRPKGMEGVRE